MTPPKKILLPSDITASQDDDGRIELAAGRVRVWSYLDCNDTIIQFDPDCGYSGALDYELPVLIEMLTRMKQWRQEQRRESAQ